MNKRKLNRTNKLSTPELNHHSIQGGRSGPLGQALPALNRRWNSSSQKPAFTIIEVVLVLAIAGLIFLMVFIALPALQRSQRNQGYRNNLTVVVGLIQNWRSNNSGRPFPVNFADFHTGTDDFSTHHFYNYINGAGLEDGISIKIEGFTTETWSLDSGRIAAAGRIFILPNSVCEAPSKPFAVGEIIARRQSGKVSVWTLLEEGDGVVYCQDV